MKVYKFGGASVGSAARIRMMGDILEKMAAEGPLMVIISAMGKTTNALEKVVHAFVGGNQAEAIALFREIRRNHQDTSETILNELETERVQHEIDSAPSLPQIRSEISALMESLCTEVEWLLHDQPVREYDYYYDQIVCIGELMSTAILSAYLKARGIRNQWLDVRDIFRTDNSFRDANIDWEITSRQVDSRVRPVFENLNLVITQGFIGSTDENESTTLGREGSDYTAAVFANLLDADSLTIWKDVHGVMNADPKEIPSAQLIPTLNYDEVIEMAYYGAQVIHPKTIKPLQNKDIPLYVKCFLDPSLPGTVIHNENIRELPPIIVWKQNQALIHLHSKDFSFVGEHAVGGLYHWLAAIKTKPNLIQSGAVTIQLCMDNHPEKIVQLVAMADQVFDVEVETELSLLSVRHYNQEVLQSQLNGKTPLLMQQTPETWQALVRK